MLSLFLRTLIAAGAITSAFVLPEELQHDKSVADDQFGAWYGGYGDQLPLYGGMRDDEDTFFPWPPHAPPPPDKYENQTIYQAISGHEHFKNLTAAVNFVEDIQSLLNDSKVELTLFAVPDWALKRPKHRHSHLDLLSLEAATPESFDLGQLTYFIENLDSLTINSDNKDKKKWKKILKKIVQAVLSYHILPDQKHTETLKLNTTHATSLKPNGGVLNNQPFRLKFFTPVIGHPSINVYSKAVMTDVKAANGFLHVITKPLLPPPSAFQSAFFIPDAFSVFTSALQRVGLTDALDLNWKGDSGAKATTVFVPANSAFKRLPERLKIFLFSPFGARVLKKLLQFHIVPEFIFHSDYVHNVTEHKSNLEHPPIPHPPPGTPPPARYSYEAELPTLFTNHTLPVSSVKFDVKRPHLPGTKPPPPRVVTRLVVNGLEVSEALSDIPARNGAFHVIGKLLNPRRSGGVPKQEKERYEGQARRFMMPIPPPVEFEMPEGGCPCAGMPIPNEQDAEFKMDDESLMKYSEELEDALCEEFDPINADVMFDMFGSQGMAEVDEEEWDGWEDWLIEWANED